MLTVSSTEKMKNRQWHRFANPLRYYLYDVPKERFTSSQAATAVNPDTENFRS
jgi:hypothetical protein